MTDYSLDTDLVISGIGNVPASSRGLKQSLEPIDNGKVIYLLSGSARDLTRPELRKFKSSIHFGDLWPPALSGVWKGQRLTINCISELIEPIGASQARTAVGGSLYYIDAIGQVVAQAQGIFRVYRPVITFLVLSWSYERDEWDDSVSGQLELTEA